MDPERFLEFANEVAKLRMFPYFEMAHCIITLLYVREDLGSASLPFSRKHPLSCWSSCMLSVYGGSMLANFLLGEPIVISIQNIDSIIMATTIWYIIFYCPFDLGYKFFKFTPIKIFFSIIKEIIRCKKVHDGVVHSAQIYPTGYLIMVIIGTIKGNGAAFLKMIERLLRGFWSPNANELLAPTFATKACILASLIFVIDKKMDIISVPHSLVYLGVLIFFIYFKLSSLILGIHDPFLPFENIFCALFMGGIWDALTEILCKARKDGDSPKIEVSRREETKKKE